MNKLIFALTVAAFATNAFAWYQPAQGRWISRDPLGDRSFLASHSSDKPREEQQRLAWHSYTVPPYLFVGNNPLSDVDALGLYTVDKCTVVLFYGHGKMDFFKAVTAKDCSGTTAVTCQSQIIFTMLAGLIPGAVDSGGHNVYWGALPPPDDPSAIKAGPLYTSNIAAMEKYAKDTLCKAPCCCQKVELKSHCVGNWWECANIFGGGFGAPTALPKTIDCKSTP